MPPRNPFVLATPVSKKLKVLLYGASGTGKTLAALTFPRPALIDSENGADLYAGRPGVQPFHILRTKTLEGLEDAIAFIRADNGQTFETLIIDPLTVFYDVLKTTYIKQQEAKGKDMTYQQWSKINNRMKAVYNALTMLPVHVVVIAREAIEYEGEGSSLRRVGLKPDVDKAAEYMFDFTVRIDDSHVGHIEKSRGYKMPLTIQTVNWAAFEPAANSFVEGDTAPALPTEDEAADMETEAEERRNHPGLTSAEAKRVVEYASGFGFTVGEVRDALGCTSIEWTQGVIAAIEAIDSYHNARLNAQAQQTELIPNGKQGRVPMSQNAALT